MSSARPRRCPKCKGPMKLRTRRGDGVTFLGCKAYPACNGIINFPKAIR